MQSVYNKIHLLEAFVQEKPNQHIICILESWLNIDKIKLLKLDGYSMASSFCREKHDGGGVCIFIKETLEYRERLDINSMSIEMIFEISAIELPKENLLIINLYWPNSKREIDVFYSCLDKLLTHISTKDSTKNVVIGGDFNVDFLSNNNEKNRLSNLMLSHNFHQKVRKPTRVTSTSNSCIDLIFTNFSSKSVKVSVEEYGFSDHRGLLFSLPFLKKQIKQLSKFKRIFNKSNINKFKNELSTIIWEDVIRPDRSMNDNYNNFDDILRKTLNDCIPLKLIKSKTRVKNLTLGIKTSCRYKRFLKILVCKSKDENIKLYYKTYCKILRKSINVSKKLNNKRFFDNSLNKTKSMWQIINFETNKTTQKYKNIELKTSDKDIKDPKLISNEFNTFFASIGNKPNPATKVEDPTAEILQNSFFLSPVEPKEIKNIIRNLKNKTSFGVDEIPPSLVKSCIDQLTIPYAMLINQSFSGGTFPDALKVAIIKPIHKKGKTTDINNYRPIALLPTSAKIFETAMINRLYPFFEKYNILHVNQNGFRKNHSTILAIYKYTKQIFEEINNKKIAVGLLLDMSKAYDRVRYEVLLNKLYQSGIRGVAHEWFQSYLHNRVQYVDIENTNFETGRISNVRSEKLSVTGSIPQGSVLGCLLFLIYINNLPNILEEHCILFADDISILLTCTCSNDLENRLNVTLDKILNWLQTHNLELNLNKTKIIEFKPYQRTSLEIKYKYKNKKIETVDSASLLGIELDTHLNWKSHIQKLLNKMSSFIYALQHLKRVTDFRTALTAYYAYAYSRLCYGVIFWGNSCDVDKVFILQKKCIRILTNIDQMESCRPFFIKHKILTVTSIYILEACKFVKKHPILYSPEKKIRRNNRYQNKLKIPFSNLKFVTSSPHNMTIKIYNHIPNSIKNSDNLKLFNKSLKKILINKCYYSLQDFFNDDKF